MALSDLLARAGNACEFCGAAADLAAVDVPPAGEVALCPTCREDNPADASHWRCLEGAAWSAEPVVQLAVWRQLRQLSEPWAVEAREGMVLSDEVQGWTEAAAKVEHRDSNGVLLAHGDSVVLIKDLVGRARISPPNAARRCGGFLWWRIMPSISKAGLRISGS